MMPPTLTCNNSSPAYDQLAAAANKCNMITVPGRQLIHPPRLGRLSARQVAFVHPVACGQALGSGTFKWKHTVTTLL